ncbi:GH39 family glycosyl hydrolase [Novosphingobium terrae]|uniref:GH39 family glycosyl hydrolase n=1 Tax=Novosphingobium terrae TaxID=2726189 RepID=UPI0019812725|nr:glycosyl hydrolase [Novosphingobium terrae]
MKVKAFRLDWQFRAAGAALALAAGLGATTGHTQPAPAAQSSSESGQYRDVVVDAGKSIGSIKPLTGFTGGRKGSAAKLALMRQIGITTWRTHDTGALDITGTSESAIFPDLSADADNPANYRFEASDAQMLQIVEEGSVPFVRLGNGHDPAVPSDYKKYAKVLEHILRHYNQGWDNGYHMNLKVFEIWNEPDMSKASTTMGGRFWTGTPQQFYELYGVIDQTVRKVVPDAVVGGPGQVGNGSDYRSDFFKYLKQHQIKLDFYSFHWYDVPSSNPNNVNRIAADLNRDLEAAGFRNVPLVVSEWGYDLFDPTAKPTQLAAYTSAILTYMQSSTIAQQYLEVLNIGKGGHVFEGDALSPAGYAYGATTSMLATPERLAVTGDDNIGFAVLAGAATPTSTDTQEEIRVLITNYEIPVQDRGPIPDGPVPGLKASVTNNVLCGDLPACYHIPPRISPTYARNSGYNLTVANLPAWADRGYTVTRYRIDGTKNLEQVNQTSGSGRTLKIAASLPAPGVELVVIRGAKAPAATALGIWSLPHHWNGLAR